ncbi:MAG: alkaline phosphatase family protein [Candidatus Poribacteria bacterium]|nr:alkaline phosphatase family protein [Candidatus Poribacteria bacterium]
MKKRKILILCIDAGSHDYLAASDLPTIGQLAKTGFYVHANAVIPSVTNVNNVSIATGTFPETHGITTNYHVDRTTGKGEFIEDNRFLLAPTLFETAKAHKFADKTALFVTKKKLLRMLEAGTDIAVAAEDPPSEYIHTAGPVEPIYSVEINWWLLRAVRETLRKDDPELVYCSTTDWVQHKYAPDEDLSQQHLVELDRIIGEIIDDEPAREIYITADHGMLEKTTALDPGRVLTEQDIPASSIPIIKDRYVAHHGNLGGAAYVFLENQADIAEAIQILLNTPGIEEAYAAEDAAQTFRLHRERIGDIFVLADATTVFGELETAVEPTAVRSHGSRHESYVPIIGYNSPWSATDFEYNVDVGRLFLESLR